MSCMGGACLALFCHIVIMDMYVGIYPGGVIHTQKYVQSPAARFDKSFRFSIRSSFCRTVCHHGGMREMIIRSYRENVTHGPSN